MLTVLRHVQLVALHVSGAGQTNLLLHQHFGRCQPESEIGRASDEFPVLQQVRAIKPIIMAGLVSCADHREFGYPICSAAAK